MKCSVLEPWVVRETGCASAEELRRWQMGRLRGVLSYAKERSRFYRERLRDVEESAVISFRDLSRVPFTTPEELRAEPQSWLCCSPAEIERIITLKTSGTTCAPKRIFFSREDQKQTVDFFACGMGELVQPGGRVMILMPGTQPGSVGALLRTALERIGVETVLGGPVTDIEASYKSLRESHCGNIVGIPVQVLGLAEYGGRLPSNQRTKIKSVLLSADAVPPVIASRIAEKMGCEVFTHFGMTEMGFGVAVECSAHQGCHIRENHILVEVIDPKTGAQLPDGQVGEFVFTTLSYRAMPFIRYRTGDMGMLLSSPCPCGSFIRRILPWGGRLADRGRLWEMDELLLSSPDIVDYRFDGNSLTLFGIVPPDIEPVRRKLAGNPGFDPLHIQAQAITGFTGTGMQKRRFSSNS